MEMELTAWKAIAYGIVCKVEALPADAKAKAFPNTGDIHMLMADMGNRIEHIRDNCTPETGVDDIKTERDEFNKYLASACVKVQDAMAYIGAGKDADL